VDDLNAVEAAVVDLIIGGLEQVVVAERVVAGPQQRASYEQDPAPPPPQRRWPGSLGFA
jgi:hypothetical protein